ADVAGAAGDQGRLRLLYCHGWTAPFDTPDLSSLWRYPRRPSARPPRDFGNAGIAARFLLLPNSVESAVAVTRATGLPGTPLLRAFQVPTDLRLGRQPVAAPIGSAHLLFPVPMAGAVLTASRRWACSKSQTELRLQGAHT